MRHKSRAFTLIELVVIIIILAVLALIVVPRMMGAGRKAREASLKSQLQELRNAIGKFEGDCGDAPARLEDLMTRPAVGSKGGGGTSIDAATWQGPYLESSNGQLPKDPFTNVADWEYTPATGHVQSHCNLISLKGDPYSSW